jgi:hypothetical protein
MLNTTLKTAVCLTASVLLGTSASAAIIYDNTETFQGVVTAEPNNTEIGDVVVFGGTDRILQSFQFEYFLGGNTGGNEMAQVFLRAMDGPGTPTLPGTLLWSSAAFNIESGYHTININGLNTTVPNSVAWTVVFSGLEAHPETPVADDESAGLLFYLDSNTEGGTNPTVFDAVAGSQQHYTIRRDATGGWELLNHPNVVDNLGRSLHSGSGTRHLGVASGRSGNAWRVATSQVLNLSSKLSKARVNTAPFLFSAVPQN